MKTDGLLCASMPMSVSMYGISISMVPRDANSSERSTWCSLSSGSRSTPCDGSASSVTLRASRSSRIAAIIAPRSPYLPVYVMPP